jgi:hypothetical protein
MYNTYSTATSLKSRKIVAEEAFSKWSEEQQQEQAEAKKRRLSDSVEKPMGFTMRTIENDVILVSKDTSEQVSSTEDLYEHKKETIHNDTDSTTGSDLDRYMLGQKIEPSLCPDFEIIPMNDKGEEIPFLELMAYELEDYLETIRNAAGSK